ncbi:MAG: DUF6328 family protein [Streptosporangiaceae bacterium]|jgi:hypothetical protein
MGSQATPDPRKESEAERDDRNLAELLQELRVAGLSVQVLFGFLLSLPDPVVRRPGPPALDLEAGVLESDLRRQADGEVRFDAGSLGAYSTDASNYRQVPIGAVVPRTVEAGAAAVEVCRGHGAPVHLMFGPRPATHDHCTLAVAGLAVAAASATVVGALRRRAGGRRGQPPFPDVSRCSG